MNDDGFTMVKPKKKPKKAPEAQQASKQYGGKKGNKLVAGPIRQTHDYANDFSHKEDKYEVVHQA